MHSRWVLETAIAYRNAPVQLPTSADHVSCQHLLLHFTIFYYFPQTPILVTNGLMVCLCDAQNAVVSGQDMASMCLPVDGFVAEFPWDKVRGTIDPQPKRDVWGGDLHGDRFSHNPQFFVRLLRETAVGLVTH